MPTRILMVCLGNICRSPVAEGVMRSKIEKYNLDAIVDSAGTSNYHIGEHPDPRSQNNSIKHGIDISQFKARQFTVTDFDLFDRIFVMDSSNYQNVIKLARTGNDKGKVELLLNELYSNENKAVPDPYYGTGDGFETVFTLIDEACEEIAMKLVSA